MFRAFTDYPLPARQGMVEVDVVAYDRNKYATVRYAGDEFQVKRGYLHADAAMTRQIPRARWCALPYATTAPAPTRRAAERERKAKARAKQTRYTLWIGPCRHDIGTLAEALRRARQLTDFHLFRTRRLGGSWTNACLIEVAAGQITLCATSKRGFLTKRHLRQLESR